MIHVLNYSENIIDDLSFKQDAIYDANHVINIQETMETFDFEVSSKIAQNLRDRHRLIIQDHMGIYREFIIENIIDLESGVTEIQANASYLDDIKRAKPVKPHSFKNQPPTVMMEYLLADTGWEVSPETEVPSHQSFEWDKVTDRLELLKELQDVFNMRLLFYVVVGKNNIEKRYVKLVEVNPMFNGEEIDYKENLIGLKREIDYSEVVTALLGVGPEDSETKKRIYVEVTDDKAQEQFGLPQRYIWDYYEVQVDSETKVTSELIRKETLKELERRKQAVVTYDISSTDIDAQVGDMIRVKDEDFNPEIYLEAEIVEIHYNLLNNVKEYKFGVLREFTREQVYSQYEKFRKELEERLKEIISNTDSIISERLEEELKYVERYIEKAPTPPLTPKEGDLWLDTSDPKVAILKRYENGKWIKSSVDHVNQIGGLTREETMYETLKERLTRNEVSYSEVFQKHVALTSEKHYHYVNDSIKNELVGKYNELQQKYDAFIQSFESINSEQPTIGLITTAISKAIEFEAKLKEYNDSYYNARKAFDEVIALLQSQYSDEKWEEAMQGVADSIGGVWNGKEIIADIPNKEDLAELNKEIKKYLDGEVETLDEVLGKKIEKVITDATTEFGVAIESVEKKVDGIEIGGRNLVIYEEGFRSHVSYNSTPSVNGYSIETTIKSGGINIAMRSFSLTRTLKPNSKYVISGYFYLNDEPIPDDFFVRGFNTYSNMRQKSIKIDEYGYTVIVFETGSTPFSYLFHTELKATTGDILRIDKLKVEKGNKATDWSPAPEDIENKIDTINTTVTKNSSSIGVLENQIALKVNSSEVTQQLNEALKPVKSDIQTNNAELLLQKNLIEQKVSKSDYTTDMNGVVTRLSTSEGKITNLENEIKLKVTETDIQNKIDNMEIGGRNLILNSDDLRERSRASGITTSKVDDGIYKNVLKVNNPNLASYITIHVDNYASYPTPNKDFTVSFLVKGKTGTGKEPKLSLYYNSESGYQEYPQVVSENEYRWISLTYNLSKTAPNNHIGVGNFTELYIARMKLERGNKATDWTPAPEDMDERIKTAEGAITVNSNAISQKVSYTEINKTNKTLERVISELIVDTRGISYQYDVNGMIQGFTLNNQYFKLNHNLIDINNGDVVIKNGKTTIKQAVINSGHIEELSFDKLKGGTATFGGPDQNGTFEVLDINGNAIMKADYEQANLSEISIGTANIENLTSPSVVPMTKNPRKYIVNKTRYGHLEEAQSASEVGANLIKGGRARTLSGGTTNSLTHTFNEFSLTEPFVAGETYTISFDVVSITGQNSGFIDVRPYEPDSGSVTIDIRSGRGVATFTPTVDSTRLLVYRDVVGKSRYDTTIKLENIKLEKGETDTIWVEAGSIEEDETSSNSNEEMWIAGSIQQAIDSIPIYIQDYIYIYVDTITDDDEVMIEGFVGRGWIRIWYNIPKNYNSFTISTHVRVDVLGGYNNGYNTGLFPNKTGGVITYNKNPYSIVRAMHLHGDGGAEFGMSVIQGSSILMRDCRFYNVRHGIYLSENAKVTAIGVEGTADEYGWYVNWGSSIWGSGTVRPMGKLGASRRLNGSRDMTDFTVEKPPTVTNPPKVPPTTIPKTVTKRWSTTSARTFYRNQPNAYTVSFMRDYPVQGNIGDGFGFRDGAWYFGTGMRNTLKGKKIKKVRVSIGRSAANSQGYVGSRKFTLRLHKSSSKPAASNNKNPSFSSRNFTASLAMGERKWFDVTSAFASELSTGNWYGFGVKTDSSSKYEYMAMAKSLTVEVTYE